jgi:hypothetical protein
MKFIKLALISLVIFFILITAMSLLLPSTVHLSRAIDINAPFDTVYNNINDVSNWKSWYASYDSTQFSTSKNTVGKGASVTFGKTTAIITQVTPDKIKAVWQTGDNTPLEGEFNFIRNGASTMTTVQWHFTQHVKWYPWQKFASIVSDKVVSPVMEKSLDNLKKKVEKVQ